jgi:DNA-binding NtrC family response regulator
MLWALMTNHTTIISPGSGDSQSWQLVSVTLTVKSGPDQGNRVTIAGRPLTIGRGETCDLRLTDETVSRVHATIAVTPVGYLFEDLGSRNGSKVNGVQVQKAVLAARCELAVGDTTLEFSPELHRLHPPEVAEARLAGLVGGSPRMKAMYGQIRMVAPTEATVVITGETGSGKEVVARTIHDLSKRQKGPFVVVDCANLNRDLLGSELFGHQKGAFTGATGDHKGAFERAQDGTLMLDELGELPLELQARLLGVLQRREVLPLGGSTPRPVNTRVVAATHRNLEQMVEAGTFRQDLYYRLFVIAITVPSLRERPEDIPALALHFLDELAANGAARAHMEAATLTALAQRPWKGNVRELRNCVERALVLSGGNPITPDLVGAPAELGQPRTEEVSLKSRSRATEGQAIAEALDRCGWNVTRAAKELGISLATMKRKITDLGLVRPKKSR